MMRLLPFLILLAACGDHRPPAPTAEESAQLNDADAMLNQVGNETPPTSANRP